MINKTRLHGGVVVSTVTSQREGSSFDPDLGPFCVEFACSPRVCVGSLWVLQLPPTVQKQHVRLIGDSKIDWQPVQGVPRLSPDDCWDRLQRPDRRIRRYRKWMDGEF